ncbi:uncharacterized protein RHOBADRAFT_54493 [Rhodotorula graminis WP1]|uniref:Uncharacterized protein n=1 Tax=Rhodotorula graminis (strain WP1) TaxID=578459 RepID=A0A0P9IVY6_RHOGW|nr:uncharacterized protein RHOBADRAFT_54493 [Rhodotorula graminis WP1]KPV73905.1 hypothetical protein RHOBADRAFT_54493 [Rhodotorula graminis WP1]
MSNDPNFPKGLAIAPSRAAHGPGALVDDGLCVEDDAAQDVERFGIAGRTWEAAYLLRSYLALSTSTSRTSSSTPPLIFDPPCPLLSDPPSPPDRPSTRKRKRTILELGAGTGFLSLAVAPHLHRSTDRLVVTDLHNVCPLLSENLAAARARWTARGVDAAEVLVRPLPWGDARALEALRVDDGILLPDLVLASDLIYFPFLYAPLLRTLLGLTEPRRACGAGDEDVDDERGLLVTSPKVVFSYKVRSLVKEQPFWEAFGRWFDFEPVQLGSHPPPSAGEDDSPTGTSSSPAPPTTTWTRFGAAHPSSTSPGTTDELYVFVCSRWPGTFGFDGSGVSDAELLEGRGERARGVEAGATRFEEMLLAATEWD